MLQAPDPDHIMLYGEDCPQNDPECVLFDPDFDETKVMERLIEGSNELCGYEKDYFLNLLDDGRVKMYNHDDGNWGDHHSYPGDRPTEIHINRYHFTLPQDEMERELRQTMYHEARHGVNPWDNETDVDTWYFGADTCNGL